MRRFVLALAVLALLTGGYFALAKGTDPNELWKIVHDRCVAHQDAGTGPTPCTEVDEHAGYAVLKDRTGHTQYLLIPTARITGIEDPALLSHRAPDYFQQAWQARHYTEQQLGKPQPRGVIALSVNSRFGRSQNQLHIHIDCLRSDVQDYLKAHRGDISEQWAPLGQPFFDHIYRARRVMGEDLYHINLFALLVHDLPQSSAMAEQTLVVAAEDFADGPGFVLLADTADAAAHDRASGEELQDHSCALAR